jgi:hypothetical protein
MGWLTAISTPALDTVLAPVARREIAAPRDGIVRPVEAMALAFARSDCLSRFRAR